MSLRATILPIADDAAITDAIAGRADGHPGARRVRVADLRRLLRHHAAYPDLPGPRHLRRGLALHGLVARRRSRDRQVASADHRPLRRAPLRVPRRPPGLAGLGAARTRARALRRVDHLAEYSRSKHSLNRVFLFHPPPSLSLSPPSLIRH